MASSLQLLLICLSLVVLVKAGLVPLDPPETRIVGGHEIEIDQAPWQVSLQLVPSGKHHCGGSIISQNWVLTAAHCIDGYGKSDFRIMVGSKSIKSGGKYYMVEDIVNHERYNKRPIYNDISLLKTKIELSPTVRPVNHPGLRSTRPQPGTMLKTSGWGEMEGGSYPTFLRAADVQVLNFKEKCGIYTGSDEKSQICVLFGNKNFCRGDSGGPVVKGNLLLGVVSYNAEHKPCEIYPGGASDVIFYRDWIKKHTNL